MFVISKKTLLHLALAAAITLTGARQPLFAQAAAGPQWKDRAEFDLYDAITKEQQPAKRLELLKQWKDKYEQSDYANARLQLVMTSYQQLGKGPETIAAANDLLAKDASNIAALNAIMTAIYSPGVTPDNLSSAAKAASQVVTTIEQLFGADKKPAAVSASDWTNAKTGVLLLAQNTVGYVAWQKKDYVKAEAEFVKSLGLNPNQGQISYWLGTNILAQKDPKKQSIALWHFARAAAYDGPGAYANRAEARKFLDRAYLSYHGSAEGEDQLLAAAKNAALPPADHNILSKVDIATKQAEKEAAEAAANPMLALWKSIKTALTGADGASYFENSMKGAGLPGGANGVSKFKGKLIEAKPEVKPKTLVLSIEDGKTADVTLNLDAALAGKMEAGADISFEGVASGYTAAPFMVTFDVEKAKVEGWKGAPAPAPAKKAAPRRAVSKKK